MSIAGPVSRTLTVALVSLLRMKNEKTTTKRVLGAGQTRSSNRPNQPVSSNWKSVQSTLPKVPAAVKAKFHARRREKAAAKNAAGTSASNDTSPSKLEEILSKGSEALTADKREEIGKYLAIDCEMVGVGPRGSQSVLARVSIVNFYGVVILDSYVRPKEKVTDYRTWVSGILPEHLRSADEFSDVAKRVAELIKDRILIGHAISNDLQALLLTHPRQMIRDTSKYQPLRLIAKTKSPGLKKLALLLLGVEIQTASHSSVDDARATMALYRTQKDKWESSMGPKISQALGSDKSKPKELSQLKVST